MVQVTWFKFTTGVSENTRRRNHSTLLLTRQQSVQGRSAGQRGAVVRRTERYSRASSEMGNSLCSPQTPGATPEGSVKEVLGALAATWTCLQVLRAARGWRRREDPWCVPDSNPCAHPPQHTTHRCLEKGSSAVLALAGLGAVGGSMVPGVGCHLARLAGEWIWVEWC